MLVSSPQLDTSWKAPNFSLSDAHGTEYSLIDCVGENGLLVAFICNHCPYVIALATRFSQDARVLKQLGVGVVAIMPNDYRKYPADSPAKMLEFAETHDFSFPYLVDETQAVAKEFGAVCTPDFFGFNKHRQLRYRGRLDDATNPSASRDNAELLEAMKQIAQTGEAPEQQVASMGCSIKWADQDS